LGKLLFSALILKRQEISFQDCGRKEMRTFNNDELRKRVDEVLYYVWDPIGVSLAPFARGEYEDYVPKVLQLVVEHDDMEPISVHLVDIIKTNMSLSPNKQHCDDVATLLLLHKRAIKEGCA
jgi:hypothetical protein